MKKITLMILISLLSFCTYGQLALEGFESAWTGTPASPPNGWAVYNQIGNTTWVRSTLGFSQTPPYAGDHAAYLDRENVVPTAPIPTNWLITPQFNGPSNGELRFFSRLTFPGDYGGIYKIKIAVVTDPSVLAQNLPWVDLVPPMGELEINPQQQVYMEKTFALPAAYVNQQIRIAFVMQGDNADRWLIDNVEVVSKCDAPSNLSVSNITTDSANLNWTVPAGVTTWEIESLPENSGPTGTGIIYSGSLPYLQTGLAENTIYKFYVRSLCSDGGKSPWAGPFEYKTVSKGSTCDNPIIIPATLPYYTTNNTANFADNYEGIPGTGCNASGSYLAGNDAIYSYTPATSGVINITLSNTGGNAGLFIYNSCNAIGVNCLAGVTASATTEGVIPSLSVTAGTTYYIVISTNSIPQVTPYKLTVQKVNCSAPTGLTATGQTPNSATLSWAVGATGWQVMIQPENSGLPTGNGQAVTQNTINVNATSAGVPFSPATNYEYYVRSQCTDGTYSIWTGPYLFATTQIPVPLPYIENFDGTTNGFSLSNGTQINKWYTSNFVYNSAPNSLYISNDNGLLNSYTITSASTVYAYRDIQIPAGANQISVSFDVRVNGQNNTDYVRAWLVPTSFLPTAGGSQITTTNSNGVQIGGNYQLTPEWTNKTTTVDVSAMANTTRRLVFEWRNDGSVGSNPAGAIDNLAIKVVSCASPTGLAFTAATPNSATFNWTAPTSTSPEEYEYYYSTNSIPPTAATAALGSVTAPATTATITPLNSSETYYIWVRSSCGTSGKSFWTGPLSVIIPQVPANLEYSQNFDGPTHEFSFLNGTQINKWVVGSATSNSASKSLYISNDDGTTNAYSNSSPANVVHAYRDINIPAGASEIDVVFDLKCIGETLGVPTDYLRVWMVPLTFSLTPGTQITAAADRIKLGNDMNNTPNWTTMYLSTPVSTYQNTTRRLIFEWRNDNNNTNQPPAAVDNLNIRVVTCTKPTSLTVTNVTNTSAKLDWTQTGTATDWEVAIMPAAQAATPPTTFSGIQVSGNSEYTTAPGEAVYGTQYAYYVRANCGGSNGKSQWAGPFLFALRPINDDCSSPTLLQTNSDLNCVNFASGSVYGATASTGITTTCTGTADDDIWFEFVATSPTVVVNFNNVVNSTQLIHTLYTGSCSGLTQIATCGTTLVPTTHSNLIVGQTYKIRVWSFTSAPLQTTSFNLCLTTPPPPPANDEYTGAVSVPVNAALDCANSVQGSVYPATASATAPSCTGATVTNDVWYKFVATKAIHKITIAGITGITTDIYHEVYSGNGSAITSLYCSDPDESWANNLTVGQTYYIRIYTKTANTTVIKYNTSFTVCVGTLPPPPANDECTTAIAVPVNPAMTCEDVVTGTITSATASAQPNTCSNIADDDVWFEFTATSTVHNIEFKNITGTTENLYHAVYEGECGVMTQLYCSDPNYSTVSNLTIGQKYKIRVWTADASKNLIANFQVCITTPPVALPANDECANAIIVPVNQNADCNLTASGTIYGATASAEPNTCANSNDDDDVWFQFTATHSTHLISLTSITGSTADLYHVVYSGNDCGSMTQLYCSKENASTITGLVIGNTYKIRVYSETTSPQTTVFNVCVRIPNSAISVSTNTYTTEELVKDVLVNSECALVSNISAKSAADSGKAPSIGYFDANGATFPFSYGVVLTTGSAKLAEGPFVANANNTTEDIVSWPGDAELNNFLVANNPQQTSPTYNASIIEFDFVPLTNKFSFDFLFASSEYTAAYQCRFGDTFAFIITDENGNKKNLAVIPNTSIPVSVLNIHDGQYAPSCGSQNVEYFGQMNTIQPLAAAINYEGQVVPMTAETEVIPNHKYHIKLAIADYQDGARSSAVFLGGGTFDLGELDMGGDLLVSNGTAVCDATTKTLDTQMVGPQYHYTWYKNGNVINGASASTYDVTQPGTYGVEVTMDNISCAYEGSVVVEYYSPINDLIGTPANLTQCDASGYHAFDLTANVQELLSLPSDPENFEVSIYLTEDDAKNGINPIDSSTYTAYTNTVQNLQTLWTRTVYNVSGCFGIKSFNLIVQDLTPAYTIDNDFSICEGTSDTIDVVITDTDPNPVTYSWTKDGVTLTDTTPSITVTEAGVYTVVLDRTGCTATSTVNVTVTPLPIADDPADVISCNNYVLPALSANNSYFNITDGTPIPAGTVIDETTDIIVRAESATTPNCTSENVFTVTITNTQTVTTPGDQTACDSYVLPALTIGNYYTGTNGTGDPLQEGDEIKTSQTIYVYVENTLAPNCNSEASFEVTINVSPVADAPENVDACESYALPALSAGNSYWTGPNGTGEQLPVGYPVEQSMDIFVLAQTETNPVCTDQNSFRVNIYPTPSFTFEGPHTACTASSVVITVVADNFNEDDATYEWRTLDGVLIEGGKNFTAPDFGTFTLTVTANNCSHTESIEVSENTAPIALIITDGCENAVYMVEVSDDNGSFNPDTTTYAWTGPGNFTSDKRKFATNIEGEYHVTITTAEGCTGEGTYNVTSTSCTIQKGISPNNDGYNDYFDLSELNVKHLSIFNRYGHEVYSKDNYTNEWTGQNDNGKELPTGTYYYVIEFKTGESKTGWIYINRQD